MYLCLDTAWITSSFTFSLLKSSTNLRQSEQVKPVGISPSCSIRTGARKLAFGRVSDFRDLIDVLAVALNFTELVEHGCRKLAPAIRLPADSTSYGTLRWQLVLLSCSGIVIPAGELRQLVVVSSIVVDAGSGLSGFNSRPRLLRRPGAESLLFFIMGDTRHRVVMLILVQPKTKTKK